MTVKVFFLKHSQSLRDVKGYMEERNIAYEIQNVEHNHITWNEFVKMVDLAEDGLESLLPNRTATKAWAILDKIDMDTITIKDFYKLAVQNPAIIRTPILMSHNNIMVGVQKEELSMFDNRKDKKSRFNQLLESVRLNEMYQLEEELGHLMV